MKHKIITEYGAEAMSQALRNAIDVGWFPLGNPTVNSQTNYWICIMFKRDV